MDVEFSSEIYYGAIVRGDLPAAMEYVRQFPERADLYRKFVDRFEREQYVRFDLPPELDSILRIYQQYYRDVFFLRADKERALDRMNARFADFFGKPRDSILFSDLEEHYIAEAFRRSGLHFQGGRTGGYYGPYIWRTTENAEYDVELPGGIQKYTVKLLDGFVTLGWLDYLSFGKISPGGWTDGDGIINCVKSSYDFESENFRVSLLKHEAQHARDLEKVPDMSSETLEYRAKLVELIYSSERNLLPQFRGEADDADPGNGHAMASDRIVKGFCRMLKLSPSELDKLPNGQVRDVATALFAESAHALHS